MATVPPLNYGALKVTFPANLPRNEKDLICMLLAGRLKDLWKGKLICAQLAINDLIRDTTGINALASLRSALVSLNQSINAFKELSGYNSILSGINSTLGQVNNVFSLGGLCPSPVRAPKVPDLLGTLNANLFGQANNILNALARASNPKVCLGGGPKGFGLDWSQVNGSLKNLKNAIDQFKANPALYQNTIAAFERNLQNQAKRFKAEVKRLQSNLSDPLGINDKRNSINSASRAKNISDGYNVKNRNGIEYKGPAKLLTTGEMDSVLARTDPFYSAPIKYQMYPILDYCGEVVGYEKRVISGDPSYAGWDNYIDSVNENTPTALPNSDLAFFDYTFVEENNTINVYDSLGTKVADINLARGKHYRLGFKLLSRTMSFYNGPNVWYNGIILTKQPDHGLGLETVDADIATSFIINNKTMELDWAVSIENPTTPNSLIWKTNDNIQGNIIVDPTSPTEIPSTDKTYDVDMAAKKAWLFLVKGQHINSVLDQPIDIENTITTRQYSMVTKNSGTTYSTATLSYNSGYKVIDETTAVDISGTTTYPNAERFDSNGGVVTGNKIIKFWHPAGSKYFVLKKYVNDEDGFQLNQINCFLTSDPDNEISGYELLANLTFDEPFQFLNDIKLDPGQTGVINYSLALGSGKASGSDETTISITGNNIFINLSTNRTVSDLTDNYQFIYTSKIQVDPSDSGRTYINTDPVETQTYIYFKGSGTFSVETTITKIG
jgi:hypothetical protein